MLLKSFCTAKINVQFAYTYIIISIILFGILHYKVKKFGQFILLQNEIQSNDKQNETQDKFLKEATTEITFLYKERLNLTNIGEESNVTLKKQLFYFNTKFEMKPFPKWQMRVSKRADLQEIEKLEDVIYTQEDLYISRFPLSNCSSPFITAIMGGHIGNSIFRVLALYMFRIFYGIRVIITNKMYKRLQKNFKNIPLPHLPHPCFSFNSSSGLEATYQIMKDTFSEVYKKPPIYKTPDNFALNIASPKHSNFITTATNNIFIFMEHRKICQSLLQTKDSLLNTARSRIKMVLQEKGLRIEDVTLVSVHVRRTDALQVFESRGWEYPTLSFYSKAFQFYRENCPNVTFVVITDDNQWVKENIKVTDAVFPGDGDTAAPEVDFAILRYCHHHIVGVGTFGTASAFLGNGSAILFRQSSKAKPMFDSFNCDTTYSFVHLGNL